MLKLRLPILSAALFLSGCSALIFQMLWLRLSGLAFGNSVWSAVLILSAFMGGMALGNGLTARLRRLRGRPLRLYAGLEVVVAICGGAIVLALPHLGVVLTPMFQGLAGHAVASGAVRFAASFLLLLAPTTAMGMTLPVLLDDPVLRRDSFDRVVAVLYGCNTLGAVIGAIGGELFLVGRFGLRGTAAVAAGMNVLAALIAWVIAAVAPIATEARMAQPEPDRSVVGQPTRLLVVAFGGGALFLALEIIWFRFLRLYVASSPTAFAVMLAVVLAGIALGSLASTRLHRRARASAASLSVLLLVAGVVTLLAYVAFPIPTPHGESAAYFTDGWLGILGLALALMFPTALVSGAIFPAVVAAVHEQVRGGRMNTAGVVTMANTIGAAVGPIVAAFVLLPSFGFQGALVMAAIGYGALALVALESWRVWRTIGGRIAIAAAATFVGVLAFFPYGRARQHLANARKPYEADGSHLVREIDGTNDTLQLLRRDAYGKPYYYRLETNGYSMSGTTVPSQRYMRMFAYLPLTFRPESQDALLICYGVGMTADALVRCQQLRHIDVVDISREVFALADDYVGPGYRNPLRDPRVTTYVQDGRFFLQANARQYDVITGEPPPLKTAGTVNLYTEEFFRSMRRRLKPGGLATFWLPIYQLNLPEVKAILRGFHDAFPDSSVWSGPDDEWIMLGRNNSAASTAPQAADVGRLWSDPVTRDDLVRIGLEVPEQLGAMFLMDGSEIARVTQDVPPLTDDFPRRLGDGPPDVAAVNAFASQYVDAAAAFQRFAHSAFVASVWPAQRVNAVEPFFVDRQMRYDAFTQGRNWLALLDLYLRQSRLRAPILDSLNTDELKVALAERLAGGGPLRAGAPELPDLVAAALARRDIRGAIQLLEIENGGKPLAENDAFLLTYLYCLSGHVVTGDAYAAHRLRGMPADWFSHWVYAKLATEFGFRPPAS